MIDREELENPQTPIVMHTIEVSGQGITYVKFGSHPDGNPNGGSSVFADDLMFTPEVSTIVGGEFIGVDSVSLILASTPIHLSWIGPLLIALIGIGLVVFRKNRIF